MHEAEQRLWLSPVNHLGSASGPTGLPRVPAPGLRCAEGSCRKSEGLFSSPPPRAVLGPGAADPDWQRLGGRKAVLGHRLWDSSALGEAALPRVTC